MKTSNSVDDVDVMDDKSNLEQLGVSNETLLDGFAQDLCAPGDRTPLFVVEGDDGVERGWLQLVNDIGMQKQYHPWRDYFVIYPRELIDDYGNVKDTVELKLGAGDDSVIEVDLEVR